MHHRFDILPLPAHTNSENGSVLLTTYTFSPGTDEPVAMNTDTGTYFYIPDIQGSIRAIVDTNGNLMASYVYDVWGNLISHEGPLSEKNDYLYTAREYDWETGIYYYRARYYDPEIGRFMQSSWELNEEMNMYLYVNNDPVKGTDPTGHPYFPPWLPDHGNSGGYIGGAGVGGGYTPIPTLPECDCDFYCTSIVSINCTGGVVAVTSSTGPILAMIEAAGCIVGACIICGALGMCESSQSSATQHVAGEKVGWNIHPGIRKNIPIQVIGQKYASLGLGEVRI